MKRRNYKGRELLPLAGERRGPHQGCRCCGTGLAVLRGLHKHENGCPHACLDEYMKSRLENKLIRAILGVN